MRFWKQRPGSPKGNKKKIKKEKSTSIVPATAPIVHADDGYITTQDIPGSSHIGTHGTVPVPEPGRKTWSVY